MNRFDWHRIDMDYARVYDDFRGGYSDECIHHILQCARINVRTSVVLDLACGTGAVLREMSGHTHVLVGMDAAAPMLAQASELYLNRLPGLCLACANGEQLPLAAESIDLVTIGQAIHWFNLPVLFAELLRVLRPGGWLAVLSRYPSPAGHLHALVEQLSYPFTEEGSQGIPEWSSMNAPSNLLGLEQAGFVNYERTVHEHEMELSVEGYLRGVQQRNKRRVMSPEDQARFSAELETGLQAMVEGDHLKEPFFDYLFMASKPGKPV